MKTEVETTPLEMLQKYFGYDSFRPLQQNIIDTVLNKKDCLVVMPTGGGKSICYQIPSLIFDGLTVVVSPLISLMKDQVDQMNQIGIPAVLLNSSISREDYREGLAMIRDSEARLFYAAPETLLKGDIISMLSSVKVDCLAIDEAHCISEWGHDFRPEYHMIASFRKNFPDAACIALTATATQRVREDIARSLNFNDFSSFIASFNRDNLYYNIVAKNNPLQQTIDFLEEHKNESGIIYTFSRDNVERIYASLRKMGYSILPYHAGLSDEERMKNQELFLKDDVQIIVATIAFGMGIHKTNVRFVVHFDLPKSIESYYQETGRAGRDGVRSECLLLYSYSDIHKIRYFINQKNDETEKEVASAQLASLVKFADSEVCRRIPLMSYFGEKYSETKCGMCDICINPPRYNDDLTEAAQMFLSCVKRCEEKFGTGHIIDVLRGSKSKKVFSNNHQNLSTYGIGKKYSREQWTNLSRQFIKRGILFQDADNFNVLKVTDRGISVLKGQEQVMGTLAASTIQADIRKSSDSYDHSLFELLREKRKELSLEENVPPYLVFSDKTLMQMAVFYPKTEDDLKLIHGVGDNKVRKYAGHIIPIVSRYCGENDISEKKVSSSNLVLSAAKQSYLKIPRHIEIGEMYGEVKSVKTIAEQRDVKESTVITNLEKYIKDGYSIDPSGLKPLLPDDTEIMETILSMLSEHGTDYLKPVFESMNGKVDYETLKVCRLYYLALNS